MTDLADMYHPLKIERYLGGMLDYIFVSDHWRVLEAEVILNEPAEDDEDIFPSDHFGLMARLELK